MENNKNSFLIQLKRNPQWDVFVEEVNLIIEGVTNDRNTLLEEGVNLNSLEAVNKLTGELKAYNRVISLIEEIVLEDK